MGDIRDILIEGIEKLELSYDDTMIDKLLSYMDILLDWNKKMNLTAIEDRKEIVIEHYLNSLSIIKHAEFKKGLKVIDIGTGAGFPGLPIKILMPDTDILLLDSLKKRTLFLENVKEELGLKDLNILHGRAEELAKDPSYRESFDLSLSRAVARLNILSELSLPFLKLKGLFLSLKGPNAREEFEEAKRAIKLLGGKTSEDIIDLYVPFSKKDHKLIKIKKMKTTDKSYPRSFSRIKKQAL